MSQALEQLLADVHHQSEILDILRVRYKEISFVDVHHDTNILMPLDVHCSYTTNQLLAGLGYYNNEKMSEFREGVLHLHEQHTDVFLVTLNKSDKEFLEEQLSLVK